MDEETRRETAKILKANLTAAEEILRKQLVAMDAANLMGLIDDDQFDAYRNLCIHAAAVEYAVCEPAENLYEQEKQHRAFDELRQLSMGGLNKLKSNGVAFQKDVPGIGGT